MICGHCLSRLPASVQKEVWQFTRHELAQLCKQIPEPEIMRQIGALGVGQHAISLNGKGIPLKNIKSIRLNFHPLRPGRNSGTVIGRITVIAELLRPHILIEEPLLNEEISVFYPYFYPYEMESLIDMIQECLDEWTCDMMPYLKKYEKLLYIYRREQARKERIKEENKKEYKKEYKKKEEESHNKTYEKKENGTGKDENDVLLQKAKGMFQVGTQYTKQELKEKRRSLLKNTIRMREAMWKSRRKST